MALPVEKGADGGSKAASEEAYALAHAVAELGRMTGDRVRDLADPMLRQRVSEWLARVVPGDEGAHLAQMVREVVPREEREERFAFGDTLPAGLRLVSEGES